MIDIDLTGWIWLWGMDLNSISVINLIMAIGLVVDYSAHIVHAALCGGESDDTDTQDLSMLSMMSLEDGSIIQGRESNTSISNTNNSENCSETGISAGGGTAGPISCKKKF